jgi:hypothetical protein
MKGPAEETPLLAASDWSADSPHPILSQMATDIDLDDFSHDPDLFAPGASATTARRARSQARAQYVVGRVHDTSVLGAISFFWNSKLRTATVFHLEHRVVKSILVSLILSYGLGLLYWLVVPKKVDKEVLVAIKEYIDLCVQGVVFVLGGFVTLMTTRWWNVRTQCVGALHQAIANLVMHAAAMWPSSSSSDREARATVTRYGLVAYKMLFLEARAADQGVDVDSHLPGLVQQRLLTQSEADALKGLPAKTSAVLGFLAAFWERIMDPKSGLKASGGFYRTSDNGRYSVIFGQLFAARSAVTQTYSYLNTQIPFGYLHLLLVMVAITSFANALYCGVGLGTTLKDLQSKGDAGAETLVPLLIVRTLRIIFIPMLLDGLILVGTVIAMPLGDDVDDFPSGTYLENLEDECESVSAAVESSKGGATSTMEKAA